MAHDQHLTPSEATAHDEAVDAARVHSRAALLPEEAAVGSDDPEAQAEIILEDSERRTEEAAAPTTFVEHRTSEQAL